MQEKLESEMGPRRSEPISISALALVSSQASPDAKVSEVPAVTSERFGNFLFPGVVVSVGFV